MENMAVKEQITIFNIIFNSYSKDDNTIDNIAPVMTKINKEEIKTRWRIYLFFPFLLNSSMLIK